VEGSLSGLIDIQLWILAARSAYIICNRYVVLPGTFNKPLLVADIGYGLACSLQYTLAANPVTPSMQ
jgi:hypothetical protein